MINKDTFIRGFRRIIEEEKLFLGIAVSFLLAIIFSFTPVWHLTLLAAVVGGLFYSKMGKGALASLIGVGGAWFVVVIIEVIATDVTLLLNQISGIILGSTSLGWLFIIIVILVGVILGALGGALGSGIMILIFERKEKSN
jgi:hypothetical protein